jgi:hypothetical protein
MKANTWGTSNMFRAKGEMACVIADNKLYMGGGVTNDGNITDDVEIHDLATRAATRAKLRVARSNISAASAANKVVFAGGSSQDGSPLDVVDIYDQSTNSWSTAKLSEPKSNMSAMVSGSKIYFIGGFSNAVDIYDATTGAWTVLRMNRQGSYFQAALLGNQMVLSGGATAQGIGLSPRVEFIDLNNWSSIMDCNPSGFTSYNSIRGENLNTAVLGDKVYFGTSESISVYNSTTKAWKYSLMQSYSGLLFIHEGQLYSLRYNYGFMQYLVIRIVI